jgi:hypothetical protein
MASSTVWHKGNHELSHDFLEESSHPWQLVRGKRWWRNFNRPGAQSTSAAHHRNRATFKIKVKGRCYNFLAQDHFKFMCRDPPRCWFCGRSGHISPFCQDKKQRTPTKLNILDSSSFPPLPPPRTQTLAATHTSAQHTQRTTTAQSTLQQLPPGGPHDPDAMERMLSVGSASNGSRSWIAGAALDRAREDQGHIHAHVVEFPGHPRLRPRVVEKTVWAPDEIQQRREMLTQHALFISEEGVLGVASREDVAEIIGHHFDLMRYEFHVFRSHLEPFIVLFSEHSVRDVVFARGRVSDGPVELQFDSWNVDRCAERTMLPFHVKISIEGLPQHAWFQEIADKVVGDAAIIHYIDQATRRRTDQSFFICWAFCHNPSQIPQLVYLTLTDRHGDPSLDVQLHFTRPRNVKKGHTFRVLVHIDSVEDLRFFHHPAEQLMVGGKVQFREFCWHPGRPNGDMGEEDFRMVQRYCRPKREPEHRSRDDDEGDRVRGHPRRRELLGGVLRWFDNRRSRAQTADRDHCGGWFRGGVIPPSESCSQKLFSTSES